MRNDEILEGIMNARRLLLQGLTSMVGFAISNAAWAGIISFHPESAIYAETAAPKAAQGSASMTTATF